MLPASRHGVPRRRCLTYRPTASAVHVLVLVLGVVSTLVAGSCGRDRERSAEDAAPVSSRPAGDDAGSSSGDPVDGGEPPASPTLSALAPAVLDTTIQAAVPFAGEVIDGVIATPDGRERTYHLYVPASLPDGDVPLLVGLHGGMGNGLQLATSSDLVGLAEANGFLALFPDGTPVRDDPDRAVWNGGGCCARAAEDGDAVDDVTFIGQLLDEVARTYPVDPDRIHLTGHSNGAILAMRLACQMTPRIASIAFQAGTLFVDGCAAEEPVSALAIHGTADQNVLIDGGAGESSLVGADFPPVRDGLAALAARNGCTAGAVPSSEQAGQPDVTVESWVGCPRGIDVQLLAVEGANHAWMGHGQAAVSERRIGPPYADLDSSEVVWAFLSAHPRVR